MRCSPEPENAVQRLDIGVLYGFRALMVLAVANYHIWQQGWLAQNIWLLGTRIDFDFFTRSSYMFVDGMILLSGLLLYLPYARAEAEGTPVPDVGRFYFNRLVRIFPGYAVAVLLALVLFALPDGAYQTPAEAWTDVLAHLTFTLTFSSKTYLFTPLNAALWTVAVEMQFYLIFPLLAMAAKKRFTLTLCLMALAGWAYRAFVYARIPQTALYINQLPAFLDVYALGMLGARLYCRLRLKLARQGVGTRRLASCTALALFICGMFALTLLLRAQSTASAQGHDALRLSQLSLRLPLSLTLLGLMLGACFMPGALQWLLSNRLMRFLSAISFQFYMWHQILSARMKVCWFSDTLHSDKGLQYAFTLLSFGVAFIVAMLATYGIERPVSKLANKIIHERKQKNERSPS